MNSEMLLYMDDKPIRQTLSGESSPTPRKPKVELANHARFGYSFRECKI